MIIVDYIFKKEIVYCIFAISVTPRMHTILYYNMLYIGFINIRKY